jgi:hypothetical protein
MRISRYNRKTRKRLRQKGGNPIHLEVEKEFIPEIENLLWFDTLPKDISIHLSSKSGINSALTSIMLQLGATKELLEIKCFAICGPTGVGKTKFINRIKEVYQAEVINMDTMQVYSDISVGTGRTNLATTEGSYLYGVYEPNVPFHIIPYLQDVFLAVKKISVRNHPIVFEGASKSLLDVLMRIFPNMVIFGIEAVNEENIIENITKRITQKVVKKVIIELSEALQTGKIQYNSPVLKMNPEVYLPLKEIFTKDELFDKTIASKLDTEFADRLASLTSILIDRNVKLHLYQYSRLKSIPSIIWFKNDDKSVEMLRQAFQDTLESWTSLLMKTSNLNFINSSLCGKEIANPDKSQCDTIESLFHSEKPEVAMEFSALLNVPLLPKKNSGQIVLGNTKYLLPYAVLHDYFNMFAIPPGEWTKERNFLLLECIALKYIDTPIIRLITTPKDLVDEKNTYRITAYEICILKTYGYSFYKLNSNEFSNVYFCSKIPLKYCELIDTSEGKFKCKTETLEELYF